jgi:hypothetical protein
MRLFPILSVFGIGCGAAVLGLQLLHPATPGGQAQASPQPAAGGITLVLGGSSQPSGNAACDAYNRQIDEAVALQTRINRPQEATRLQGMKQNCTTGTSPHYRSARG